jgi:type IV pilus assembly protein PilN
MTRINLLPWREMRRKQLDLQLLRGGILGWVLVGLIVLIVHLHYADNINSQNDRNKYLQEQIVELDKQIKSIKELQKKKTALVARMEIIQRLQSDRTQVVHIFDDLVRKMPEGIFLTSYQKKDKDIILNGVAQSNGRVSLFMRNLEESNWYTNPHLNVIKVAQEGGHRVSNFTLQVTQTDKQAAKAEPAEG